MKFKVVVLLLTISTVGYSQIVEAEKDLRDTKMDTIDGWKTGGLLSLNGSQVSLTNWNAGGQNTISMNGLVSMFANYTQGKAEWENSLDLGYGIQRQGRKDNVMWVKTDDKIDLVSKYGRKATKHWYYSAMLNFTTQMTAGYNYPNDSIEISGFMAPAYTLLAAGMDYKPAKYFSAFIAPVTLKTTIVNDQTLANQGAFGVDPAILDNMGNVLVEGSRSRFEAGGYIRLVYDHQVMENVKVTSKLGLFSNYLQNPQNIDVNWETLIQFKVNKFISATLGTHLIYDDDVDIAVFDDAGTQIGKGPRLQFKEVLGIGFAYKFPEPKKKEEKAKEDK
ncbi:DUF3078 domain-containing protein [Paracrocinitomix mangrovi]|uniref:DUF3078 domain-containing protein n=1 Tax=Paracrocinitomix mangrovi TaxID=2862509 RepID=UPI001C8EF806|nr:DUF3078 domain-containing protein [Paracrocinitomix mangrovi]UKN00083.1 DUF3078 domain-containing protein [Paracrocinitomix mangrovi]